MSAIHSGVSVAQRIELSDEVWQPLEQRLSRRSVPGGVCPEEDRRFITAVLWVLKQRCRWQELPAELGGWRNTQRRFERWRDRGMWEWVLEALLPQPEFQWLLEAGSVPLLATEGSRVAWLCAGGQGLPDDVRYMPPWLRMVCRSDTLIMALAASQRA